MNFDGYNGYESDKLSSTNWTTRQKNTHELIIISDIERKSHFFYISYSRYLPTAYDVTRLSPTPIKFASKRRSASILAYDNTFQTDLHVILLLNHEASS